MAIDAQAVQDHYRQPALFDAIVAALARAGKDLAQLVADDLAPVDEFHNRGRPATVELARLLDPTGGLRVLDLGCGLGGPARHLAQAYGCRVTGLDLTPEFVAVAARLTALTRQEDSVDFCQGDALATPFAAASFDVVWSQNVAMNIADRARLYAEIRRVLRPGGRYALSDVVTGTAAGDLHYPMPWARGPEASHLLSSDATRRAIEAAGFSLVAWEDTTASARAAAEKREGVVPPPGSLGLQLVLGSDFPAIGANLLRNLRESRIGVVHAVALRA